MPKAQRENRPASTEAPETQAPPMQYDVKINSIRLEGSLLATASVNLNGCFAIRGIKIMDSEHGPFVSMPRYKANSGEYRDICFPCTKEAHAAFTSAVLGAYEQALTQSQSRGQAKQAEGVPTAGQAHSAASELGM